MAPLTGMIVDYLPAASRPAQNQGEAAGGIPAAGGRSLQLIPAAGEGDAGG